jgi:hypothetical protein
MVVPINPTSFCFWGRGDCDPKSNNGTGNASKEWHCENFHNRSNQVLLKVFPVPTPSPFKQEITSPNRGIH